MTPEVFENYGEKKIIAVMFPPLLFIYFSSDSVVIHNINFLYKRAYVHLFRTLQATFSSFFLKLPPETDDF